MVICADTSFLYSVYGNDLHSQRATAWLARGKHPISLSVFNHFELGNALRFAEFRKALQPGEAAVRWAQFEAAMNQGRVIIESCNLADVVDEAKRLSSTHTLSGGHRAFDVLHVAGALQMGASQFLTFDANQKKLAVAEGMTSPL